MANIATNILHDIESAAKVAAPFTPPPYNTILGILGGLASTANTQATAAGVAVPDLSTVLSLIPPVVLNDLIQGKTVTVQIDGSKLVQPLMKALGGISGAFKIKT